MRPRWKWFTPGIYIQGVNKMADAEWWSRNARCGHSHFYAAHWAQSFVLEFPSPYIKVLTHFLASKPASQKLMSLSDPGLNLLTFFPWREQLIHLGWHDSGSKGKCDALTCVCPCECMWVFTEARGQLQHDSSGIIHLSGLRSLIGLEITK